MKISRSLPGALQAGSCSLTLLDGQFFGKLNEKQTGYVRQIDESGKQLLSIFNDMLDVIKIDSGEMEIQWEEIPHAQFIDPVVALMDARFREKNINVETFINPDLTVKADVRKRRQIMENLLSNAIKYTPDRGRVKIHAAKDGDSRVRVEVRDSGIGISEDNLQKIFLEFHQIDRKRHEHLGGTGIGLSLTRRLVELLGVLFTVVIVILMQGCFKRESELAKTAPKRDLLNHPVYSKYEFSKAKNVINIGTQPLWVPTGLITESLKRDIVLRNALSELAMEIRFFPFLKGDDVNFFLERGDLDVGIGGDMPAVTAAANINVVVPVLIQNGFISIVAHRNILVGELRGKRIGYAFGSNAHYALLDSLESEGITENDVNLVSMDITDMPENLHKGTIAAFSAWEPIPSIAVNKYSNATVIHRSMSTGYMYFLKTFSDKYPQAVRKIVAAQVRAIRWLRNNRKNLMEASGWALLEGKTLSGREPELSVEQNLDLAEDDILGLAFDPIIPERLLKQGGALHREFEFLKTLDEIPASESWGKVQSSFNRQILKEVLANQNKYALNEFKYETNGYGNE